MMIRFNHTMAAVAAGATVSFAVAAMPALAQDDDIFIRGVPQGVKVERVSYRDLNLRYIAHLNILNGRVERAVRHVCDYEPRDLVDSAYRKCSELSWAGARPQVHRAYLRANGLAYDGR